MTGQQAKAITIETSGLSALNLETERVPYVHLGKEPAISARLLIGAEAYTYLRSHPIVGSSAVLPAEIAELYAEGRRVLVAERDGRYLIYVA